MHIDSPSLSPSCFVYQCVNLCFQYICMFWKCVLIDRVESHLYLSISVWLSIDPSLIASSFAHKLYMYACADICLQVYLFIYLLSGYRSCMSAQTENPNGFICQCCAHLMHIFCNKWILRGERSCQSTSSSNIRGWCGKPPILGK